MGEKNGFLKSYDFHTGFYQLSNGLAFTESKGAKIGAKLGLYDYLVIGPHEDVSRWLYLRAQEDYEVTTQSLNEDLRWVDGGPNIYITIENVSDTSTSLLSSFVRTKVTDLLLTSPHSASNEVHELLSMVGVGNTHSVFVGETLISKVRKAVDIFTSGVSSPKAKVSRGSDIIFAMTGYPRPQSSSRIVVDCGSGSMAVAQIYKSFKSI